MSSVEIVVCVAAGSFSRRTAVKENAQTMNEKHTTAMMRRRPLVTPTITAPVIKSTNQDLYVTPLDLRCLGVSRRLTYYLPPAVCLFPSTFASYYNPSPAFAPPPMLPVVDPSALARGIPIAGPEHPLVRAVGGERSDTASIEVLNFLLPEGGGARSADGGEAEGQRAAGSGGFSRGHGDDFDESRSAVVFRKWFNLEQQQVCVYVCCLRWCRAVRSRRFFGFENKIDNSCLESGFFGVVYCASE